MASLCRSWLSVAALALYLVINIGAASLHQHLDQGGTGPASLARQQGSVSTPDHDTSCLFCQVFHLARTLAVHVQFDVRPTAARQALPGSPGQPPCRLAKSIQARAPPPAS